MSNWFVELTGFEETTYAETRSKLSVNGTQLVSHANGRGWEIGHLETPSLAELRAQAGPLLDRTRGKLKISNVVADAHAMHANPEAKNALVQVASQFNLLEMTSQWVSPDGGVTCYQDDKTQGPACAIAAGPATIYRNYFAPVGQQTGQTAKHQINTLADLLSVLPGGQGIHMRNGYALAYDTATLRTIGEAIAGASPSQLDHWRSLLRIGLHWNVEVTAAGPGTGQRLTQALCSALPISYSALGDADEWEPFGRLVLEAAYEATLWAGVINAARNGNSKVYLTLVGGGAFDNKRVWILDAIQRAIHAVGNQALDVQIISYKNVYDDLKRLVAVHGN
ncbi:MAG: hypothetical protein WBK26_15120 [Burkholderiaceae bacterium]